MNRWSKRSKMNLYTCHDDLRELFDRVLIRMDCSVICGYRNEHEQNRLYPEFTELRYPDSKHNTYPSNAVDVIPYVPGVDPYKNHGFFLRLACIVFEEAMLMGIEVKWGGNWKSLVDMAHWELV